MSPTSLADGYLGSHAQAALFDAPATLSRMLEFEAALAIVASELGLIPAAAAAAIAQAAAVPASATEVAAVMRGTAASSTPAVPMVELLIARVTAIDEQAARYVHWGSTSQDVMDSALMLQARAGLAQIDQCLARVCAGLAELTAQHRGTLMVARTLSQHAAPSVFGLKLAGWLDGLLIQRGHLARAGANLPLQCGGAVGTLAALGADGPALRAGLATRLGLRAVVPWHSERSVVRELAGVLGMTAAAAGKVGFDLILLAQTEIAEVDETASAGRGGSSALPQKRNPVAAIGVCAGARRAPGLVATVLSCFEHLHERAAGAWHAEWAALCELFVVTGAVVEQLERALAGLLIDEAAVRANLERTQGLVMAEAVAQALAPALGRPAAQAVVGAAARSARADRRAFAQVLAEQAEVIAILGADGLARALDPAAYLGSADLFIDEVLARHRASAAT